MADERHNDGFGRIELRVRIDNSWKAAYGLELIRINAEADEITKATGKFCQPYYPSEDEFREARRVLDPAKRRRSTLRIRNPFLLLNRKRKKGKK